MWMVYEYSRWDDDDDDDIMIMAEIGKTLMYSLFWVELYHPLLASKFIC